MQSPEPLGYDRHGSKRQKKVLADSYAGESREVPRLLDEPPTARSSYGRRRGAPDEGRPF
ncbi:hypothetical protein ABT236_28640 [Streptomyces sp. NPDC001523]|uniref:hypothetical protein n=1 Tax=Streptomyces sp. NPDC001523 TaxID=3154383 RepID=UPI00332F3BAF